MVPARALRVAAVAAALFVLTGCSEMTNREDFASQLKNKTETEVIKFAGKPASVDGTNPERVMWAYKARTFDVTTRRTDPETDVIFTRGADGKLHVADVVFK